MRLLLLLLKPRCAGTVGAAANALVKWELLLSLFQSGLIYILIHFILCRWIPAIGMVERSLEEIDVDIHCAVRLFV